MDPKSKFFCKRTDCSHTVSAIHPPQAPSSETPRRPPLFQLGSPLAKSPKKSYAAFVLKLKTFHSVLWTLLLLCSLKKNINLISERTCSHQFLQKGGHTVLQMHMAYIRFEANSLGLCSQQRENGLLVFNPNCFGEVAGIQSLTVPSLLLYTDIEKEDNGGPFSVDIWSLEALQQISRFKSNCPDSRCYVCKTL